MLSEIDWAWTCNVGVLIEKSSRSWRALENLAPKLWRGEAEPTFKFFPNHPTLRSIIWAKFSKARQLRDDFSLEIKVKRKDCCHSTLRYTHYPTTALVVINTLLELFWHFVFKWSMFLKFYWFTQFSHKISLSRFTHFFRRFFLRLKSRNRKVLHF